jgi:UDP:flavonoid glycosyltransferase YjiC (YdhE family)
MTEAVYHGVPLVGIPMFGDQDMNMAKSVSSGFALSLKYLSLTEDDLLSVINRVLVEPEYALYKYYSLQSIISKLNVDLFSQIQGQC